MAKDISLSIGELFEGKEVPLEGNETSVKINWKKGGNKRVDIVMFLEYADENSINIPALSEEFGVSRQYIYDILKEHPRLKEKTVRKPREIKKTTISARILQYIKDSSESEKLPSVKEVAKAVGTTPNYVFTVLNKNIEYKSMVDIEKREPRDASNEEIIAFINDSDKSLTITEIAEHFNEKYNVIHGVVSRNMELINEQNLHFTK